MNMKCCKKWTKDIRNERVLGRVNNQALDVDLHKSKDVLTQHPTEHMLEVK